MLSCWHSGTRTRCCCAGQADTVQPADRVWSAALAQLARILTRAFEADLDGLFFAFTMANLAGRILAYACGSEAQAVALMDNLINGLARERARAAA